MRLIPLRRKNLWRAWLWVLETGRMWSRRGHGAISAAGSWTCNWREPFVPGRILATLNTGLPGPYGKKNTEPRLTQNGGAP